MDKSCFSNKMDVDCNEVNETTHILYDRPLDIKYDLIELQMYGFLES